MLESGYWIRAKTMSKIPGLLLVKDGLPKTIGAYIIKEIQPYFLGAYEVEDRYIGIICDKKDSLYANSICKIYGKDIDLIKLKIDIKLGIMGFNIKKLGF